MQPFARIGTLMHWSLCRSAVYLHFSNSRNEEMGASIARSQQEPGFATTETPKRVGCSVTYEKTILISDRSPAVVSVGPKGGKRDIYSRPVPVLGSLYLVI